MNILSAAEQIPNLTNLNNKPYVILVSLDGFRWDYLNKYPAPTMKKLAKKGMHAERMIPVFPTLTFPNHYSIVTGLYPDNHKLIGNTFPNKSQTEWYRMKDKTSVQNGKWYGGEPIWVAAVKNGLKTAAYYFVGTEASIQKIPLTYWKEFDSSVPGEERVNQVLRWLALPEEERPQFITLYFEDVDTAAHRFGPDSKESIKAIKKVDNHLQQLISGLNKLPFQNNIYTVIVSDHGLIKTSKDSEVFIIDNIINLDGLNIVDHGSVSFVYFPEQDLHRAKNIKNTINKSWKHGRAMLLSEAPKNWHISKNGGYADLIIQANEGHLIYSTASRVSKNLVGHHGWTPDSSGMHAIFIADGPRIPQGLKLKSINSVDVYPLIMELLNLPITSPIDGDTKKLVKLLH